MRNIAEFESDDMSLVVTQKSKREIKLFIEVLLDTCNVDSIDFENIQINILDFDEQLFYIPVSKVEIIDIKNNKFLDLKKLYEKSKSDLKNIYRGERSGSFESYYLDSDDDNNESKDFGNKNDDILSKIESIDAAILDDNVLVFYNKV